MPLGEQAELLERLEFGVIDGGDYLDVTVPPFRRNDVTREVDLIEEVARLWGLEKLPATMPAPRHERPADASSRSCAAARPTRWSASGFSEAIGWSFQSPEIGAQAAARRRPPVRLRNPLSEDLSEMRTTLLGSLLTSVRHNVARGREDVRLFEEGAVYFDRPHGRELTAAEARSTPLPDERMHLGALMTGRAAARRRGATATPPSADFFAAKGALETLLGALRVPWTRRPRRRTRSCTRAARRACSSRGEDAGWLGELHPGVASRVGPRAASRASSSTSAVVLPHAVVAPHYEDLTSFPAIRQDLAFWIPADRTAAELVEVVRGAGGKLLRDVRVFDVYAREGQTSLAVRLEFRAGDRTLTDEEIAPQRTKIVEAVEAKLEGELRG